MNKILNHVKNFNTDLFLTTLFYSYERTHQEPGRKTIENCEFDCRGY